MRELVVGALLIFGLLMGAAPRAVAQPIDPVLGPVWERLRSELHHGERLRLRVEEAQEGGDTRLNYVLGDLRSEQRERVLCYCLACKPDQVAARRAGCAVEVLGRYRGHYGEPKLHRGLAIGGGVLIALGVGVAVAGGLLYGLKAEVPNQKCLDEADMMMKNCIWLYPTALSGALLGATAIVSGISLLVSFDRERRSNLEIERNR